MELPSLARSRGLISVLELVCDVPQTDVVKNETPTIFLSVVYVSSVTSNNQAKRLILQTEKDRCLPNCRLYHV